MNLLSLRTFYIAIILLAGLQTIPTDLYEAFRLEGGSAVRSVFKITIPLLKPYIILSLLFRSAQAFGIFDLIQVMTGGGPAMRTELLWTMIARIGYKDANMGYANAMSYVSIILSIAFTYYFFTKLVAARRELGQ